MRKAVSTIFVVVALTLGAFAHKKPEPLEDLKARADRATAGEKAKLCAEVAERQIDAADSDFTAGNVQQAQTEVQDSLDYAVKASDAATSSGKRLKETEIALRKLSERMESVRRSLAFEDRPPLQAAIDRIQQLRNDLLAKMFDLGKPLKEKK